MANIIDAIINIINNPQQLTLLQYARTHNRANNMGDALEKYIQDVFANTIGTTNNADYLAAINQTFSFLGSPSRPPDCILIGSDAVEVKKVEITRGGAFPSELQLNSSHPKDRLLITDPLISNECKTCEDNLPQGRWQQKDIIYAVGVCNSNSLKHLSFVYGDIYAAVGSTYNELKQQVINGIKTIPNINFSNTRELGRINGVDPLRRTNLRVRGMWLLKTPLVAFNNIVTRNRNAEFELMSIMSLDKFNSFSNREVLIQLVCTTPGLEIKDIQVQNPNNPAKLIDAKLITFYK